MKIFSGWQTFKNVEILRRIRDWLHPILQGVDDGSVELKQILS
jgi:hypothetical protein